VRARKCSAESPLEVQRLRSVYEQYTCRGLGNSKWSSSNRGNEAVVRERNQKALHFLQNAGFLPLSERRILDVGCGAGAGLSAFKDWGARAENLFGVDLLPERIQRAQERYPEFTFQLANAESLPFADASFDLIIVFTVFTSILDPHMAANVAREIARILRHAGAILWYDFRLNNPFNPHVRGVTRKSISQLFPGFDLRLEPITLLPPLARRMGSMTRFLYPPLARLPFLRTHYLGLLIKT
jgi:ubiquinone/menaquinone biosynthesis C-methylase UbiE